MSTPARPADPAGPAGPIEPAEAGDGPGSDASDASFTLEMARKDVRLMIETAGEGLQVLPAIAAAMDKAIGEGKLLKDFAIFAKRS